LIFQNQKKTETRKVIRTVKVLYEYEKKSNEELNLAPNDVINVFEVTDDGWWVGEVNGVQGLFPSNFTDAEENQSKVTEVVETSNAGPGGKKFAVALYDYDAQEPGELNMKEGDLIEITVMGEDGWWTGNLKGASGIFPSNYTELKK